MKKNFLHIAFLLFPLCIAAQGVLNNGGKIVLGAGSFLTIRGTNANFVNATSGTAGTVSNDGTIAVQGNWTNNASNTVFINTNTTGSVTFNGTTAQVVNGTSNTVFENIILNNATTITLQRDITVLNFTHNTGGRLVLNGRLLTINGTSTLPASSGTASITGSIVSAIIFNQSITGNLYMTQTDSLARSLSYLRLNRIGATLNIGNALNIIDSIVPTAGTIASGGNIRLIANQTGTGKVGRVGIIGTNGSISGNVTVQTFINPPGNITDWRLLGVAGVTGRTFSNWDDDTYITCSSCPDGYSIGGVNFTSILSYIENPGAGYLNNDPAHYSNLTAITAPINPGRGYWVYMGSSSPQTSSSGTLLDVTGPIQTAISLPLTKRAASSTEYGWNLIANPLPSPILWSRLRNNNNNVDATMYVFSSNYGDLVSYNALTGISVPSSGSYKIGNVIPMGMGFYVHASANTTLTANETTKTSSLQYLLKTDGSRSAFAYFSIEVSGNNMMNETAFLFDENTTAAFDENYDALDIAPNYEGWLQISSFSDGIDYSVNALPALPVSLSIPIKITSATTGSYKINPLHIENLPEETCMILHDKYNDTNYDLKDGAFNVTLHDTETVARFTLKTFCADTIATALAETENDGTAILNDGNTIKVLFNYTSPTNVSISVVNALGQKVKEELNEIVEKGQVFIDLGDVSSQMIFVSVKNLDQNRATNKKVFIH